MKQDICAANNVDWGFWGTSVSNNYDPQLTWVAASEFLRDTFCLGPENVRDVLDSRFGRHLADDLSFIKGGPIANSSIKSHLSERLTTGWAKYFNEAIFEVTGINVSKAFSTKH